MPTPQNLDEFIHEAQSQHQRRLRIAIVGDPTVKPWVVRIEAYNKLYFDISTDDQNIFSELHSKLSSSGFEVTLIERQPYEGKLDPEILQVYTKLKPTGLSRGGKRKRI